MSSTKYPICFGLIAHVAVAGLLHAERIQAHRTTTPPVLDGQLNDTCWKRASVCRVFYVMNSVKKATPGSSVRVAFDDNAIFFGLEAREPKLDKVIDRVRPHDGPVSRDECFEIMIDTNGDQSSYVHLIANTAGSRYDEARSQTGFVTHHWDGEWNAAVARGGNSWTMEIRVPFFTLGIDSSVGETWRINVARERRIDQQTLSCIARNSAFHTPGKFVPLEGLDVDFTAFAFKVKPPQIKTVMKKTGLEGNLLFPIEASAGPAVLAEAWLEAQSGKVEIVEQKGALSSRSGQLSLGPIPLRERGKHAAYLVLKDFQTGRTVHFSRWKLDIDYVPIVIDVLEPFYRDCIFSTQKLKEIVFTAAANLPEDRLKGAKLRASLISKDGKAAATSPAQPVSGRPSTFRFAVAPLADGRYNIFVETLAQDGDVIASARREIRKLPYHRGEVWWGRDLVMHVDGKPFFPLGSWGWLESPSANFILGIPPEPGNKKIIAALFWSSHRKYLKEPEAGEWITNYTTKKVMELRERPDLLAWFISDEPEVASLPLKNFVQRYEIFRELDPYHPVMVSNDSVRGGRMYSAGSDMNWAHPYPSILKTHAVNDLGLIRVSQRDYLDYTKGRKQLGFMHQGFNYGDFSAVNGRIPTYHEYRAMNWLAIIYGAKAIIQYNRMASHYPELHTGLPHLTNELGALAPVILSQDSSRKVGAEGERSQIDVLAKEHDGHLYFFAGNATPKPTTAVLNVEGLGNRPLHVVSEGRTVVPVNGRFEDDFQGHGIHLYTTAKPPVLPTVKAIEAEIEARYQQAIKPGNLAHYTRGSTVTASSNQGRAENVLWHVTDGVIDTDETDRYQRLRWTDTTPDTFPDWLEIKLSKPAPLNRIVIHTSSLQDFAIQAFVHGEWKEVANVIGNKAGLVERTFKPVESNRVRLFVSRTRGPLCKVSDVELYGSK